MRNNLSVLNHRLLQIIYVAWAALDWVLKPSKGNAKTSACITALVQLLHRLLMSRSPNLGMTQACCLGVPILLRLLAGSTSHDPNSCDLVTLVLNTLDAKPDMDIAYKDDRLWAALQQLLTVICKLRLGGSHMSRSACCVRYHFQVSQTLIWLLVPSC